MTERAHVATAIVTLAKGYDAWVALFDSDKENRRPFVDEEKTIRAKVSEEKAIVVFFNVDIAGLLQMVSSPAFIEKIKDFEVGPAQVFVGGPLAPPA